MGRPKKYITEEERIIGYKASIIKRDENRKKQKISDLQSENIPVIKKKWAKMQKHLDIIVTNKNDITKIMRFIDEMMQKYESRINV